MCPTQHPFPACPVRRRGLTRAAFSLIEVLVVIALLSLIIIGLVTMFGQTQRAFKLGTAQVDVLEAGRAVTDMMTRELSQMAPAYHPDQPPGALNCYIQLQTNFFQLLPGSPTPGRTNLLEDLFFLTKENQRFSGLGYQVLDPVTRQPPAGGVGTLYRYETNGYAGQPVLQLNPGNPSSWATDRNVTRLLDGVVHFKIRAYDPNGMWLNQSVGQNIRVTPPNPALVPDEPYATFFLSNAVPASVEIELGILEARTLDRIKSISNPAVQAEFLRTNAVGKVHLFRWRVPIRNADPSAYQ